jgi:long-chain acyl-CoA synthetase
MRKTYIFLGFCKNLIPVLYICFLSKILTMHTETSTNQDFIWYKKYPKDIAHTIDADQYSSLADLMEQAISKFRKKVAFIHMGVELTYEDIDRLSLQFAAYLQTKTKLKQGDRIAIQMPNVMQYIVAMFGSLRAGLIIVNTNPLYTQREMEHQFNDSGAKAIVILANFAHLLEKVLPQTKIETVIITEIGDLMSFPKRQITNIAVKYVKKLVPPYHIPNSLSFRQALGARTSDYKKPNIKNTDVAFLQYTGGTTGVSKGAMLTHRNIIANMLQIKEWIKGADIQEGVETIITALPLYHIFSLTVNCFAFFAYGGRNVLITNPRDMKGFIAEMAKYDFTVITGVNTLFNGMLNQPKFKQLNFKNMKTAVAGGMALQTSVNVKWKEITGKVICEGYGLTESSPVICCNPVDGTDQNGTIGIPLPSTEVKIMNDEGNEVAQGERGELWAKGAQMMLGYWQRPEDTAQVMENGWLKTGDIAIMQPDGFFKIVDRKKDMILVSGFNVYPNEVEDVVAMHPKVLEVAAIGVPDDKSTEAVKVFVVKKDDSLSETELREFCKDKMTGYKLPKHIEFRKELPKSNVGKILRRLLKDNNPAGDK